MISNSDKNVRLLQLDPIPDPCADGLLCTAMDDETADKRMNSAVLDFYELSCTASSNLKIRFSERGVGVRVPPGLPSDTDFG
jgi:hypothetical protein